jgi:putative transposase
VQTGLRLRSIGSITASYACEIRVHRHKRRYRATTDSRHGLQFSPNLLAPPFTVTRPNTAWVTDMTYLWTPQGWLYLSVIIDLFPHRIVGWSMSEQIDRKLALDALRMALAKRRRARGFNSPFGSR